MADQDQLAAAVREHRKAVEIAPDNGWYRHNLGMAYERQRNYEEAAAEYRQALDIDPGLAYTRYRLGMICSSSRKYDEAVEQYLKALQSEPENSLFHYALGAVYARTGKLGEAISRFRKAIDLDFYNSEAHFGLANALLKQGNREEGEREMAVFREQRKGNIADLERSVGPGPGQPPVPLRARQEVCERKPDRQRHQRVQARHRPRPVEPRVPSPPRRRLPESGEVPGRGARARDRPARSNRPNHRSRGRWGAEFARLPSACPLPWGGAPACLPATWPGPAGACSSRTSPPGSV